MRKSKYRVGEFVFLFFEGKLYKGLIVKIAYSGFLSFLNPKNRFKCLVKVDDESYEMYEDYLFSTKEEILDYVEKFFKEENLTEEK